MGSFVESVRNGWLDDFTSVSLWLALFDGDPTGAGTELSGGSYARVEITAAQWNAASAGSLTNNAKKEFPTATADWNGGTAIPYWGLFDASTAGNLKAYDTAPANKIVTSGDKAIFDVNQITLTAT